MANPFLSRPPDPRAIVRLFCFPYAGAGSSRYFRWCAHFPSTVEICPILLPGRESRIWDAPYTDLETLSHDLCDALTPGIDRPFAFFGHSMGGLIAFELAREMRRRIGLNPLHLFASACRAPQLPGSESQLHELPEVEFILRLRQMNYVPDEIYNHPQLLEMLLPAVRADYRLCERYEYRSENPLECPITAIGGLEDRQVTIDDLAGWSAQTERRFTRAMFPGGHLFLHDHEPAIADCVVTALQHTLATTQKERSGS